MRDLPPLIFQGLSVLLANHFNLNTVQFWFYKRYQEAASVVSDSENDWYQMGSPLEKRITICSTNTFFFLVQSWEMLTQSNLRYLVPYEQLPHFYWDYEYSLSHSQWIQFYEAKVCWYPMKLRYTTKGLCFANCFHTIKILSDFQTRNSMSLRCMGTSSGLLQLKMRSTSSLNYSVEKDSHILIFIFQNI